MKAQGSRWRGAWALLVLASAGPAWAVLPPRGEAQPASQAQGGPGGEPESAERRPSFLPDALVVKLRPAADGEAADSAARLVRRVLAPIAPGARLRPVFRGRGPAAAAEATVDAVTDGAGGVYRVTFPGPVDVPAAVRRLAADPRVEYAEPVYLLEAALTPNDPYLSSSGSWGQPYQDLWGLHQIGAPEAWDVASGEGAVVAVVDTGLDFSHPDIAGRFWTSTEIVNGVDDDGNGYVDDLRGWDFTSGDDAPLDDHGHGTHVAGTIAAARGNAEGISGVSLARVMAVRALDATGTGTTDQVAAAVRYAAASGADVINLSLGFFGFSQVLDDALAEAHAAGLVLVAAAGNASGDAGQYHPCRSQFVLCVSAGTPTGQKAWFSNRGLPVDLMAPGGADSDDGGGPNVLSLRSALAPAQPYTLGQYVRFQGTSMAAPHVAGAAAILLAAHPGITNEQVRQALRHGAVDAYLLGWDADSGHGRLAIPGALARAADGTGAARILSLRSEQVIATSTVPVLGTATATEFVRYELAIAAGSSPTSFSPLHASTGPVARGLLATWDLGSIRDGVYVLRLRVFDQKGRTYEDRVYVTVDRVRIDTPTATDAYRGGEVITVTGTAAVPGMTGYSVRVFGPGGWSTAGITLAGGGASPVVDGTLATWDTSSVAEPRYYALSLDVHRADGGVESHVVHVLVDPTLHAGWPVRISLSRFGPFQTVLTRNVTAADVDGNGTLEMLLAQESTIFVLQHDGSPLPGWPVELPSPATGHASPVAVDLDGDGRLEVVVATTGDLGLRVFASDGTLRYQPPRPPGGWGYEVAVADVAGDARPEIVLVAYDNRVWILDAEARPVAVSERLRPLANPAAGVAAHAPALADLDGDGKAEIVVATTTYHLVPPSSLAGEHLELHVLRGDGTPLPGFPRTLGVHSSALTLDAYPVVADLDGDGQPEIVTATDGCEVFVVSRAGTPRPGWPLRLPGHPSPYGSSCGPVAVSDVDGDGLRLEIVLSAKDGELAELHVLDPDGREPPPWPVSWTGRRRYDGAGGAAIADVDGDGAREIVASGPVNDPAYALRGLEADGSSSEGFPRPTLTVGAHTSNVPAVADFDADGLLELAWVNFDGYVFLWDLTAPARPSVFDWTMYRGNPAHTGAVSRLLMRDGFESGDLRGWSGSAGAAHGGQPPPP